MNEGLQFISDLIVDIKRRYRDPYLVIGGDFNQWNVAKSLADFADLRETEVSHMRGNKSIGRIFSNLSRATLESGTLLPLETESAVLSDHRIAYMVTELPRIEAFEWLPYSYLTDNAQRSFYKTVRCLKSGEKLVKFNVRTLALGKTDQEAVKSLDDHFNAVSGEFVPLQQDQYLVWGKLALSRSLNGFKWQGRLVTSGSPNPWSRGISSLS